MVKPEATSKFLIVMDAQRLDALIEGLTALAEGEPFPYGNSAAGFAGDLLAARRLGMWDYQAETIHEGLGMVGDCAACDNLHSEQIALFHRYRDYLRVMLDGTKIAQVYAGINFRKKAQVDDAKARVLDMLLNGTITAEEARTRGTILETLAAYHTDKAGQVREPALTHTAAPALAQALYREIHAAEPATMPNADPMFTIAAWQHLTDAANELLRQTPRPHDLEDPAIQMARRIMELDTAKATPNHGLWSNMLTTAARFL